MTLEESRSHLAALQTELLALAELDEQTEAQALRWTEGNAEFDTLRASIAAEETRQARIEEVRSTAIKAPAAAVESGDNPAAEIRNAGPTMVRKAFDDPFDVSQVRSQPSSREWDNEMRGRVEAAIESKPDYMRHMTDAHRESVHNSVTADSRHAARIAQHCLITGSERYHDAFELYVRSSGQVIDPRIADEFRTAMSLTDGNGGFLVPFTLDPTIILSNAGATDPFRGISSVVQITTNDWNGVVSAGVTAEWLAEATEAADATPTFTQPVITPQKAAAWLFGSYEVLQDSGFSSEVQSLLSDARDRLEATAHAVGTGSGQPWGVVTAVSTSSGSRVSGASGNLGLCQSDPYTLASALPPRYRANASWAAEFTVLNAVRQLATGTGPQHAFWADLGVGTPPLLLGKPVYEASGMDSTIVSGSTDSVLLIGDFRAGYKIVDRVGMSVLYEPMIKGSSRIPTGQAGWFAFWRTGAHVVDVNAFRLLVL